MSKRRKKRVVKKPTKPTAKVKRTATKKKLPAKRKYTKRADSWANKGYLSNVQELPKPVLEIGNMEREEFISRMFVLCSVQSYSGREERMKEFVTKYIEVNHPTALIEEDVKGNIYVTSGFAETYPCVVAHLDTVHSIIKDDDYHVVRDRGFLYAMDRRDYSRSGIGGDDKVGLWIALESLAIHENIKLAFFVEEERGCIGSSNADAKFFEDVSLVLEADRQGYGDFVNSIAGTSMYSKGFAKKIAPVLETWGRTETTGGLTDVKALISLGVDICMANASCGYYRPHTNSEYIDCEESIMTLFLFRDIINTCHVNGERWGYKRIESTHRKYGTGYGGYYWGDDIDTDDSSLDDNPFNGKTLSKFRGESGKWVRTKDSWVFKKEKDLEDDLEQGVELEESEIQLTKTCQDCGSEADYGIHAEGYYCHSCNKYDFNLIYK